MSALRITRLLPAPIEEVFEAWTQGDLLARWFVCVPRWTSNVTCDARVGGRYRIEMIENGKVVGVAYGSYLELDPPRRLVFSWTSDGKPGVGVRDSVVVVELRAVGDSTELTLTHDIAPDTAAGRAHDEGWNGCLDALEGLLGRRDGLTRRLAIAAPVERVWDAVGGLDGIRGWWTTRVRGSAEPGGTMLLEFEGLDEHIAIRVQASSRPTRMVWEIEEHTSLDEWAGTRVHFAIAAKDPTSSVLAFRHEGLTPKLVCYEDCEAGWEHFLGSLVAFVEHGAGEPFGTKRTRKTKVHG